MRLLNSLSLREREGARAKRGKGEGTVLRQRDGTEALARVRDLRRHATAAEAKLWAQLRNRRIAGAKFRRQMWIGPCIADFACLEAKLIVEADGSQHGAGRDAARDAYLAQAGWRVLRFWNNDIAERLDDVLEAVRRRLEERLPSPSRSAAPSGPLPLPAGERG